MVFITVRREAKSTWTRWLFSPAWRQWWPSLIGLSCGPVVFLCVVIWAVKLIFTVHSRPHTSQMKSLEDTASELDLAVEPFRVVLRFSIALASAVAVIRDKRPVAVWKWDPWTAAETSSVIHYTRVFGWNWLWSRTDGHSADDEAVGCKLTGYLAFQSPFGQYQSILLGDRGTCVNNLPEVKTWYAVTLEWRLFQRKTWRIS